MDSVLQGTASAHDIDRFVAAWHEGDDPRSISEFLGFTPTEYARWVEDPNSLTSLLRARARVVRAQGSRKDVVAA